MSILPNPLHPAIVHLPIAIALLAPLFAIGALWAIRRGAAARFAWTVPTALLALLLVSGWTALQTGEGDEERVEDTVGRGVIHAHEEAAEAFLLVAGGVLLVTSAGFMKGRAGEVARMAGTAGTLAVLAMGFNVGHTGGKVAYPDADTTTSAPGGAAQAPAGR